MNKKYRITPKGKVVFSVAGIIILILVFMLIQSLLPDQIEEPNGTAKETSEETSIETSTETSIEVNNNVQSIDDQTAVETNESVESDVNDTQTLEEDSVNEELNDDESAKDVSDESSTEVVDEVRMEKLYNAKTTVYFEPDMYVLNDEYKLILNIFIGVAKEYPEEKISVEGNINGYPKFNDSKFGEELSEIRANKIAQYLMNMGIEENRLMVTSNGSSKPLNKSDSKEELMLNRRTDIFFTAYFLEEEIDKK